jgi:hypothetical protein
MHVTMLMCSELLELHLHMTGSNACQFSLFLLKSVMAQAKPQAKRIMMNPAK